MASVIHLQPAMGYTYYTQNKSRLEEELVEIATNEETNTSVYMTDNDGMPYLYVYRDDKKIFQSECQSQYITERNLRMIYAQYLAPMDTADNNVDENASYADIVEDDDDSIYGELDAMSEDQFQDMIDEREDVIYTAVHDLIEVLTEDSVCAMEFCGEDDDSVDTIVDHIVEYLAINCGLRIRRPMTVVDDETGLHVRTEYPYEEFDFREELHG